MASASQSRL